MDGKQEADYKSLYIDALTGLEQARGIINETIRQCKAKAGGDYRLERMQTHGVFTRGGKDLKPTELLRHAPGGSKGVPQHPFGARGRVQRNPRCVGGSFGASLPTFCARRK